MYSGKLQGTPQQVLDQSLSSQLHDPDADDLYILEAVRKASLLSPLRTAGLFRSLGSPVSSQRIDKNRDIVSFERKTLIFSETTLCASKSTADHQCRSRNLTL